MQTLGTADQTGAQYRCNTPGRVGALMTVLGGIAAALASLRVAAVPGVGLLALVFTTTASLAGAAGLADVCWWLGWCWGRGHAQWSPGVHDQTSLAAPGAKAGSLCKAHASQTPQLQPYSNWGASTSVAKVQKIIAF